MNSKDLISGAAILSVCLVLSFNHLARAENLSGKVSQDTTSYPGATVKSLTLTPGSGTFSGDHLGFGKQVVINLYNPNPYAMRFDTVQRIGKEYSWVVPANSSRTVGFKYFNPVSDEVRFLSYQDPSSLQISQGKVSQPVPVAEEVTPQTTQAANPAPIITPAQEMQTPPAVGPQQPSMRTQSHSAVRGYW